LTAGGEHSDVSDPTTYLDGIVYEETQRESQGFDLTVADVLTVESPGRVDFGGGELAPATTASHPTAKRNPDDDYAWWHLDPGQYLLSYNEQLAEAADVTLTVQTRDELRKRGAFHPTLQVESLAPVPLTVGGAGLLLKENARVSTVVATD
jgi:hypothetical protein